MEDDDYCGIDLPPVFMELRKKWLIAESGRTSVKLAEWMGVSPQRVSQWATGTDGRRPPWTAILKLCDDLGCVVVVTPTKTHLRTLGG